MKVVLFGATGQLGQALRAAIDPDIEVVPAPRSVDLRTAPDVEAFISAARPDWVINAAAMTDVDGAHLHPDQAFLVNSLGPAAIARACAQVGSRMIQVSTEAVFDGEYEGRYREVDACRPVSVYGAAKLAGEHLVLAYCPTAVVVRTSWLYSNGQGANFPTRLLAQLRDSVAPVKVVTDIVGNPTPAPILAQGLVQAIVSGLPAGTYHVCCTGAASKHDWARHIAQSAGFDPERIVETTSDQYVTVAARPRHVDLDTEKFERAGLIALPAWQDAWAATWSAAHAR